MKKILFIPSVLLVFYLSISMVIAGSSGGGNSGGNSGGNGGDGEDNGLFTQPIKPKDYSEGTIPVDWNSITRADRILSAALEESRASHRASLALKKKVKAGFDFIKKVQSGKIHLSEFEDELSEEARSGLELLDELKFRVAVGQFRFTNIDSSEFFDVRSELTNSNSLQEPPAIQELIDAAYFNRVLEEGRRANNEVVERMRRETRNIDYIFSNDSDSQHQ